ncbi:MAG: hypothetical protein [Caudoviricetes sp.]|nr:MAG: hypothetical protein [Caudoviricetes sp.]
MSGGLKSLSKLVSPLKKVAGDITGTRAARDQAAAQREATEAQTAQYQESLTAAKNENTLDSAGDLANVATVNAAGTANDADTELNAKTKQNRKNAISATLGL